jgi:uncharacterized SAM-binding protein YcdF (DUF218 family)
VKTTRAPHQVPPAAPAPPTAWGVLLRWLGVLLAVVLVVAPVAAVLDVMLRARAYDTTPTGAIVVLGASQYNGQPSPVFTNRLDHARDLWQEGVAPEIITVGGKVPGDVTTEAEAGRDHLIAAGVPADAVVAIPAGSNTVESLEMVNAHLRAEGKDSITIVSDRLHLARARAIATALGLEAHVSGRAFADGSSFPPRRILHEASGLLWFHAVQRWSLRPPEQVQWQTVP